MCSNTFISLQLGKTIQHKACFIIKFWISYGIYWILYWKWKTEWLYGSRMLLRISGCFPSWLCDWLGAATAQHHKRGPWGRLLTWEKIKIQNSRNDFYSRHIAFGIVKSKNCLIQTTVKSGVTCIYVVLPPQLECKLLEGNHHTSFAFGHSSQLSAAGLGELISSEELDPTVSYQILFSRYHLTVLSIAEKKPLNRLIDFFLPAKPRQGKLY